MVSRFVWYAVVLAAMFHLHLRAPLRFVWYAGVRAAIFNLHLRAAPRFVWYVGVLAAIFNLHLRAPLAATGNDRVRGRGRRLAESGYPRRW